MKSTRPATASRLGAVLALTATAWLLAGAEQQTSLLRNPKYAVWLRPAYLRGANVAVTQTWHQQPTAETFTSLRAQGANFVKLVAEGIQQINAPYGDDTAAARSLDLAVRNAGNAGLYVVISMLTGPGLVSVAVEAKQQGLQSVLWVQPAARTAFAHMWQRLASRYRGDSMVIGYNLIVEPLPEAAAPELKTTCCASKSDSALRRRGLDWPAFADRIIGAIRQRDSLTPIVVDATGFAAPSYFAIMRPVHDRYVVYDVHQYEPTRYTEQGNTPTSPVDLAFPGARFQYWRDGNREHTLDTTFLRSVLWPVAEFQRHQGGVPVIVGEFGVNRQAPGAAAFIAAETKVFDTFGWHGAIWLWGPFGNMEVTADDSMGDQARRAILRAYQDYWRGTSP